MASATRDGDSSVAKSNEGPSDVSTRGIMMILSPAKTLDLTPFEDSSLQLTEPSCDKERTLTVAKTIKKRTTKQLEKLLGISSNLAETAHEYWNDFELDPTERAAEERKPAIYAFSGAAYQGLQISSCSPSAVHYMQSNLRIIDPLYGTLKPLDCIQPYRLEMATKGLLDASEMGKSKSLADWWKASVTNSILEDLAAKEEPRILLNLASDEYSAAVDEALLSSKDEKKVRYIKIVFRQEGRVIAVHAKRARGLMVRYLSENHVTSLDQVQDFGDEGYRHVESASSDDTIVFDREKPEAAATSKASKKTKKAKETDDEQDETKEATKTTSKRRRRSS